MNISQMFRNFSSNSNLQQLSGKNGQVQNNQQLNRQQPQQAQSQVQSQGQGLDQYIPQGNAPQESAGIYSPLPRGASGQFVEHDNEAVSFNPYTFNPSGMQEGRPQEGPNQSERPEGMPENGEFSAEMPDLPPIPEGEEFNGELPPELPEGEEIGSMPPAKPEESGSESGSESESEGSMTAQRPGGMRKPGGAAPVSGSEDDDEDSDSELQKLEQERSQLTQRLNTERDNNKKAALRVELHSVESQITQLKAQAN
ncbi:MAG: hypothetical protein IJT58_06020 [Synergistaceae bacterium]|nr:hypothetical protein [Synergistaceae bacterium]